MEGVNEGLLHKCQVGSLPMMVKPAEPDRRTIEGLRKPYPVEVISGLESDTLSLLFHNIHIF